MQKVDGSIPVRNIPKNVKIDKSRKFSVITKKTKILLKGTITNPRQTNTRHDKPQT